MSMLEENTNIKFLNDKLDKYSISILKCMQNIISERQYLEDNLKEGYINLAKSRYLMRGRKISMIQINTYSLKASLKSFSSDGTFEDSSYTIFESHANSSTDLDEINLKRRLAEDEKLSKSMEKSLKISDEQEAGSNGQNDPVLSPDDPLRWFGVLVPDTLKCSQARFTQAIKTALNIASLQNELKALCGAYKELRLKKKQAN